MTTIKSIIVEDEQRGLENLSNKIARNCPGLEVIAKCRTGEDAIDKIHALKPHLVFLDVELGKMTGFDVLDRLKHISFEIIFTTAHEQYAIQAIKANALDYLKKPVRDNELIEAVDKARQRIKQTELSPNRIFLPDGTGFRCIELKDVPYCEADDNCTKIYFPDTKFFLSTQTLSRIEQKLPVDQFFRIHRSYIINRDYMLSYSKSDGGFVTLNIKDTRQKKDKFNLSVARDRKKDFLDWLLEQDSG